jgi:hypothetical protein
MSIPTLIATPGSASANSYGNLAEASIYHNTQYHPGVAWEDSDDEIRSQALIMATQWMEALIDWTGYTTSATQALAWPRVGMARRNLWTAVPDTEVPTEVKNAQFELARLLIYSDRTVESDVAAQGITSLKVGSIALTFKDNAVGAPTIPAIVSDLLVPSWIMTIRGQQMGTRELERA